jgi:hypothetical protein
MLAKRRKIHLQNGTTITTPLLLPSFSSKTLQEEKVKKILDYQKAVIADEILVSAYDVHYKEIRQKQTTFSSTVFLDSGGYEASQDVDLSDQSGISAKSKKWTTAFHEKVLRDWDYTHPTVVVSYDSPRAKVDLKEQISRAKRLFSKYPLGTPELLIKTERTSQRYLDVSAIVKKVNSLKSFAVIGVTEKEIGGATLDRMLNIARLRTALNDAGLETPIHVFGSLDTVSSVLYFLSGADIFDGLTWLRYAFEDGNTLYKHNYGSRTLGISFDDFRINAKVWNDNYYYLLHLKEDMGRFLLNFDFNAFRSNSKFFDTAYQQFQERLKED